MKNESPVLVWFRSDLRLEDNPALRAACELHCPLVPFFIWAPDEEEPWPPGAASRWWLHQSLTALAADLVARRSRLILRQGPTLGALKQIMAETGAQAIFWNRRYEPSVLARDAVIKKQLLEQDVDIQSFNAGLLFEPWTVLRTGTGQAFQVFSPYWKACLKQPEPTLPSATPAQILSPEKWPWSLAVKDLELEPRIDWAKGIRAAWTPGEFGANAALTKFLTHNFERYSSERDFPSRTATSSLSPHLHFGEISVRKVWHSLQERRAQAPDSVDSYLREVGWREFAYYLLFHFPQTTNKPLRAEFAAFPWNTDKSLLKSWQKGKTGYPFIDAGMRELWATGWMHNRVRLAVASFLTKHLRISWEEGAYWFWDTLVDADLANNTLGWQWTAGCGADAAPYFRIFNPVLQSERFDPNGDYIRRWVPELRHLAAPWIHKPWLAPALTLAEAGVKLGESYPSPVVDHAEARAAALAAFHEMRRSREGV